MKKKYSVCSVCVHACIHINWRICVDRSVVCYTEIEGLIAVADSMSSASDGGAVASSTAAMSTNAVAIAVSISSADRCGPSVPVGVGSTLGIGVLSAEQALVLPRLPAFLGPALLLLSTLLEAALLLLDRLCRCAAMKTCTGDI